MRKIEGLPPSVAEKRGKLYYRHRWTDPETGKRRERLVALEGKYPSPTFWKSYYEQQGVKFGEIAMELADFETTVTYVVKKYRESARYIDLSARAQSSYDSILNQIIETFGDLTIHDITIRVAEEHTRTPNAVGGAATRSVIDKRRAVWRLLGNEAVRLELFETNRFRDIEAPKNDTRGYLAWSEEDLNLALEKMQGIVRRAVWLGAWTGQRRGDILRMKWTDIEDTGDGQRIVVTQGKTKAELSVYIHPSLLSEMKTWERDGPYIVGGLAEPHPRAFDHQFNRQIDQIGLERKSDRDLKFHGLRKTIAATIISQGGTVKDVQAVTGHRSSGMADYYAREFERDKLGKATIERMEKIGVKK